MADETNWSALALEKLSKVLGDARARDVYERALEQLHLDDLRSAQDLYLLGKALRTDSPVVAACGASLGLTAVMRGAIAA